MPKRQQQNENKVMEEPPAFVAAVTAELAMIYALLEKTSESIRFDIKTILQTDLLSSLLDEANKRTNRGALLSKTIENGELILRLIQRFKEAEKKLEKPLSKEWRDQFAEALVSSALQWYPEDIEENLYKIDQALIDFAILETRKERVVDEGKDGGFGEVYFLHFDNDIERIFPYPRLELQCLNIEEYFENAERTHSITAVIYADLDLLSVFFNACTLTTGEDYVVNCEDCKEDPPIEIKRKIDVICNKLKLLGFKRHAQKKGNTKSYCFTKQISETDHDEFIQTLKDADDAFVIEDEDDLN